MLDLKFTLPTKHWKTKTGSCCWRWDQAEPGSVALHCWSILTNVPHTFPVCFNSWSNHVVVIEPWCWRAWTDVAGANQMMLHVIWYYNFQSCGFGIFMLKILSTHKQTSPDPAVNHRAANAFVIFNAFLWFAFSVRFCGLKPSGSIPLRLSWYRSSPELGSVCQVSNLCVVNTRRGGGCNPFALCCCSFILKEK